MTQDGRIAAARDEFRDLVKRIKQYGEAEGVLSWDLQTGAPRKGAAQRAEVVGLLSAEAFKLAVSDRMGRLVEELSTPEAEAQLDPVTRASLKEARREYERNRRIPPETFQEFAALSANAQNVWPDFKAADDFEGFRPYLERIVAYLIQFCELWGYEEDRYDALLDQYEPGLTARKLDALFPPLRQATQRLLTAIAARPQPRRDFLFRTFPEAEQRSFCEFLLSQMGFAWAAGRLDTSVHPVTFGLNPGDVRVTTNYDPQALLPALFSALHEGGHALYEQNLAPELLNTPVCDAASMGLHESQSRFWENVLGRSREFWERYLPDLVRLFPEQLAGVTVEDFYRAVNTVEPSLIRIDADELTYNLHVMVRYELERDLLNERLAVADLPGAWAAKMREYLGVTPTSHATGVLQDIHWSNGLFGYFPSYALGNMYAAQLAHALARDLPDYPDQIRRGDFAGIRGWLAERVWRHGKTLTPGELVARATGEEPDVKYLIAYLDEKFGGVYGL